MSLTPTKPCARLGEAAQALVGTPFVRQGRSPAGVDCVGLLLLSAHNAGVDLSEHDYTRYGNAPSAAELRTRLDAALEQQDAVEPGAVLLMDVPGAGATHIGIVAERGGVLTLVHAVSTRGCVIEHRLDSHMARAINTIYGLKKG